MTDRHIGGQDFLQHSIDREAEEQSIDDWRREAFERHCAVERAKALHPSHWDEFGATNCFGEERT